MCKTSDIKFLQFVEGGLRHIGVYVCGKPLPLSDPGIRQVRLQDGSAITIDWHCFDQGCTCGGCLSLHDVHSEMELVTAYYRKQNLAPVPNSPSYLPMKTRVASLKRIGIWDGDESTSWSEGVRLAKNVLAMPPVHTPSNTVVKHGLTCSKCGFFNEYAGSEHMNKGGNYVCYNCKP